MLRPGGKRCDNPRMTGKSKPAGFTDEEAKALRLQVGSALDRVRRDVGMTQEELGALTGKKGAAVSANTRDGIESVVLLAEYEAALGVPRGTILMRSGIISTMPETADAIRGDARLTPQQVTFVVSALEMCLQGEP